METTLLGGWSWAQAEFGGAALGDERRTKRLLKVAAALAQEPQGALHAALESGAELMAAYRLVQQEDVTYEAVSEPHKKRTRENCRPPGDYLLVEDTSSLDFTSHEATEGLGRIGDDGGRGLYLHSTLALRIEHWNMEQEPAVSVVGLFDQRCWARTTPTRGTTEKKGHRLARERESLRWANCFEICARPPAGCRWTLLSDRESDIYETFEKCTVAKADWIVRSNQPRALAEDEGSVRTAVADAPRLGTYPLELRARPGHPQRSARLEIRATRVTLRGPWRPGGAHPPLAMNVVEAREVNAPPGADPIHWILLTSWPVDDFTQAQRVVKAYTRRWLIEEYHKALKSGASVEESQLTTAHSLKALIGVLAIVALRLLDLKLLATAQPDTAVTPAAMPECALTLLETKYSRPRQGWTHKTVLVAIARIGGFQARKNDGAPGWICIWRGWHRLMLMVQGFLLARRGKCV